MGAPLCRAGYDEPSFIPRGRPVYVCSCLMFWDIIFMDVPERISRMPFQSSPGLGQPGFLPCQTGCDGGLRGLPGRVKGGAVQVKGGVLERGPGTHRATIQKHDVPEHEANSIVQTCPSV